MVANMERMKPLGLSDLVVGCYETVRTRRILPAGWKGVMGHPPYTVCPNGHHCDIGGDRVVCEVCGAAGDVVVETWSQKLHMFV